MILLVALPNLRGHARAATRLLLFFARTHAAPLHLNTTINTSTYPSRLHILRRSRISQHGRLTLRSCLSLSEGSQLTFRVWKAVTAEDRIEIRPQWRTQPPIAFLIHVSILGTSLALVCDRPSRCARTWNVAPRRTSLLGLADMFLHFCGIRKPEAQDFRGHLAWHG